MSSVEVSQLTCSQGSQLTCCKGFELQCDCGLDAKRRVSRTESNKFRLFYNCSKTDFGDQCKFFQWADEHSSTGDKHLDEINELSSECRRLQQRIDLILQEHENERAAWNRERMEVMSRLSSAVAELDQMKTRIKKLDDSDSIPFYDNRVCSSDDNEEDAKVIQAVESQ